MTGENLQADESTTTGYPTPRWSIVSASLGALLWLVSPLAPVGVRVAFWSIEHLFVFLPLVAAPLALLLLSVLVEPDRSARLWFHAVAGYVQPVAAALVLASFMRPTGALAGGLTALWLVMALALAMGGVRSVKLRPRAHLSNFSLLAAQIFLPVGAVWLLLSRLGVGPRNFPALTVFLAALHFHYSGFTLQILIGATGRLLHDRRSRLGMVHGCLAVGAILGIPVIAAGNILSSPVLKVLGVASMVLSTLTLAITSTAAALTLRSSLARALLLVSSASIALGMVLAAIYGVGEFTGAGWIGIPRMVAIHGFFNAVGFTFCGLLGHLCSRLEPRDVSHITPPRSAASRRRSGANRTPP